MYADSSPDPTGQQSPKERQHPPAPVDDDNVTLMIDGGNDLPRYLCGIEDHGKMVVVTYQRRTNKARADIGETNVQPTPLGLLLQRLEDRRFQRL